MRVERSWHGPEIAVRMDRAMGRAIVAFGLNVVVETKRVTHVIEGNLRRSVHAAPAGYDGSGDLALAEEADLPNTEHADVLPGVGRGVEVGSWLPYACVEWIGRGHPGVTQGLEAARPRIHGIVAAAVRAEGLA